MRNFLSSTRARVAAFAGVLGGTVMTAGQAFAVPAYDLSPTTTGFIDQVQSALTIGLPIAAGLIALSVGISWVRKLLKSK